MKICNCGHNSSAHRYEPDKFRGGWLTSCRARVHKDPLRDTCRCPKFREEDK